MKFNVKTLFWNTLVLGLVLEALAQCPVDPPCQCLENESGTVINCRSKGLIRIPLFKPTSIGIAELDLFDNSLESVGRKAFYTTAGQPLNVTRINLYKNYLSVVHDDAFIGMTGVKELLLAMHNGEFPSAVIHLPQLEMLKLSGLNIVQLPPQALQPFTSLRILGLWKCNLEKLVIGDLDAQRNSLEELSLWYTSLSSIPNEALKGLTNLRKLILLENFIKILPSNGFPALNSLEYLNIGNSDIHSIQAQAFAGLKKLKELELTKTFYDYYASFNPVDVNKLAFSGLEDTLESLSLKHFKFLNNDPSPIQQLRNLQKLYFDEHDINSVDFINANLFFHMENLQELTLARCSLYYINLTMFAGSEETLTYLDLSENYIGAIDSSTFQMFKSLRTLILRHSVLRIVFTADSFLGLEDSLEYLDLSSTGMLTDHLPAISHLRNLRVLKLNHNHGIKSLPDLIFSKLTQLQILDLSVCSLSSVQPEAVHGLQNSLTAIDLSENYIHRISHCTFKDFTALVDINVSSYYLKCDCHIRWLKVWLDKHESSQSKHFCQDPYFPYYPLSISLRDINAEDLLCENGEEVEVCHGSTIQHVSMTTTSTPAEYSTTPARCPVDPPCECFENKIGTVVSCHSKGLTRIPPFRPTSASFADLDFAMNNLMSIHSKAFYTTAGQPLDVTCINLSHERRIVLGLMVHDDSFIGLEDSLEYLDLSNIGMLTSHLQAVSHLRNLRVLKLRGNFIYRLPNIIFSQLTKLQTLDLSSNSLYGVRPAAMYGLQNSLENIDLSGNKIVTISHCTFKDFSVLESINLTYNPLLCDCHTLWLRDWLDKYQGLQSEWVCATRERWFPMNSISTEDMLCEDGGVEVCQELATPPANTSLPYIIIFVNDLEIRDDYLLFAWNVLGGPVMSFLIEATKANETTPLVFQEVAHPKQHEIKVDGLLADTEYTVCVTALYKDGNVRHITECVNITTVSASPDREKQKAPDQPNQLAVVVGTVVGSIFFVTMLITVVMVTRKWAHLPLPDARNLIEVEPCDDTISVPPTPVNNEHYGHLEFKNDEHNEQYGLESKDDVYNEQYGHLESQDDVISMLQTSVGHFNKQCSGPESLGNLVPVTSIPVSHEQDNHLESSDDRSVTPV